MDQVEEVSPYCNCTIACNRYDHGDHLCWACAILQFCTNNAYVSFRFSKQTENNDYGNATHFHACTRTGVLRLRVSLSVRTVVWRQATYRPVAGNL